MGRENRESTQKRGREALNKEYRITEVTMAHHMHKSNSIPDLLRQFWLRTVQNSLFHMLPSLHTEQLCTDKSGRITLNADGA